jgi:hypothetical protein
MGVLGEIPKLPVLSPLSTNVMPMPTVGVPPSVRVATGEASIVTVKLSAMPSGPSYAIGALVKVGALGVA